LKPAIEELKILGRKNDAENALHIAELDNQAYRSTAIVNSAFVSSNDALRLEEKYETMVNRAQHLTKYEEAVGDDESTWEPLVCEASTLFRQFITECTRLRALGKICVGPLPDKWSTL